MNRTGYWVNRGTVALDINGEYVYIASADDFYNLLKERLGYEAAEYFADVCMDAGIKLIDGGV